MYAAAFQPAYAYVTCSSATHQLLPGSAAAVRPDHAPFPLEKPPAAFEMECPLAVEAPFRTCSNVHFQGSERCDGMSWIRIRP